ncbi:MAG: hypothetical protein Q9226_007505, partial [Calogaya cf. arnoldii]
NNALGVGRALLSNRLNTNGASVTLKPHVQAACRGSTSPAVDFVGNKVKAFRTAIPWPDSSPRRASISPLSYGSSNAYTIVEQADHSVQVNHNSSYIRADDKFTLDDDDTTRPFILVLSVEDAISLRANVKALAVYLINHRVKISVSDLAYTLSERRIQQWYRAFITIRNTNLEEKPETWTVAKKSSQAPSFGFVLTGQGD